MDLSEMADRYDDRLRTVDYADLDASANGLQVGPEEAEIEHVAFAVDAAIETIERAGDAGADLLVTHHGLIWDGLERVTGRDHRRIAALMENDLALYVTHLPLDGHQELGNAAGVGDLLDLDDRAPFGSLGPEHVGQRGRLPESVSGEDLRDRLAGEVDHEGRVRLFEFGPDAIESVGIVTGSGADWLPEAAEAGLDAFVTGEGKQKLYHDAKELGVTVVLAGHYGTETFGVESLASLGTEWGLETTVLDCPTGL
ncbi:MAG: Nif3-like dinuclear metal center hexameric protein [Halobacteriales archaeon]